jgi:hypothetical protein
METGSSDCLPDIRHKKVFGRSPLSEQKCYIFQLCRPRKTSHEGSRSAKGGAAECFLPYNIEEVADPDGSRLDPNSQDRRPCQVFRRRACVRRSDCSARSIAILFRSKHRRRRAHHERTTTARLREPAGGPPGPTHRPHRLLLIATTCMTPKCSRNRDRFKAFAYRVSEDSRSCCSLRPWSASARDCGGRQNFLGPLRISYSVDDLYARLPAKRYGHVHRIPIGHIMSSTITASSPSHAASAPPPSPSKTAAAPSPQQQAALSQLLGKYARDQSQGAAPSVLSSLSRQIFAMAKTLGQNVRLPSASSAAAASPAAAPVTASAGTGKVNVTA